MYPRKCLTFNVDDNGRINEVKLTDFGLAKLFETLQPMMSPKVGTLGYKAPEQFSLQGYRQAVDMWSLGIIAYILLCGYPPFRSNDFNDPSTLGRFPFWLYFNQGDDGLIGRICSGSFDFNTPHWDGISLDAKSFITGLLQVDPKKRMSSKDATEHRWFLPERPPQARPSKRASPSQIAETLQPFVEALQSTKLPSQTPGAKSMKGNNRIKQILSSNNE